MGRLDNRKDLIDNRRKLRRSATRVEAPPWDALRFVNDEVEMNLAGAVAEIEAALDR